MGQSSKKQKQEARAAAAETMRLQKAKEKRRARLFQGGIAIAVVLIVVVVAVAVLRQRDASEAAASGEGPSPTGTADDGAYVVGPDDAPVTIDIVEDLQCPVCKQFESISGDLLAGYLDDDSDVQVRYHGVAFLDGQSTTDYSTRALQASGCVMDEGVDVWRAFHQQMYVQQPAEGSAGLTDDEIVAIAVDAGADEDAVSSCVADETYAGWVNRTTQSAVDDGVNATPTITVNGTQLPDYAPDTISAAVEQARQS